jgi:hypothetical protein
MQLSKKMTLLFYFSILLFSCSNTTDDIDIPDVENGKNKAKIVSVTTSGNENNYNFNVGISSPDKGCSQYANWWEVTTETGVLIYRRILGHSHVNEQPFIRSGRSVKINKDQIVIIRLHMNNSGYSINAYKGSVSQGFNSFKTADDFAKSLENQSPQPTGCAF